MSAITNLRAPESLQMGTAAMKLKDVCSLEGKLWPNLDTILKSKDITLPTKVGLVKPMVFPVVTYGCESWAIKKDEQRRIDAFELWCWRRPLRVPWTARRSYQCILNRSDLNIHCKDWCWSWNSNTLSTWCKELTHWKRPWCWERLKAGGEGDDRVWDGWMASPTQWTWVWVNSGSWWWTGRPGVLWSMGSQRLRHDWVTEQHQQRHKQLNRAVGFERKHNHSKILIVVFQQKFENRDHVVSWHVKTHFWRRNYSLERARH